MIESAPSRIPFRTQYFFPNLLESVIANPNLVSLNKIHNEVFLYGKKNSRLCIWDDPGRKP